MTESIARTIDHALLHPKLTDDELRAGCRLALALNVASVCVKPYAVPLAAEILAGSQVAVSTVIGYPHGSHTSEVKAFEARQACEQGATELDMVVNVGRVLSRDWKYVEADIRAVVQVAHEHGAMVKVIFENEYLSSDELKIELCRACERAGADFIKTSTGFGFVASAGGGYASSGATEHDVRLMKAHAGSMQVKAAGGVRNHADALRMIELGATRIGTSASEAIVNAERRVATSAPTTEGY